MAGPTTNGRLEVGIHIEANFWHGTNWRTAYPFPNDDVLLHDSKSETHADSAFSSSSNVYTGSMKFSKLYSTDATGLPRSTAYQKNTLRGYLTLVVAPAIGAEKLVRHSPLLFVRAADTVQQRSFLDLGCVFQEFSTPGLDFLTLHKVEGFDITPTKETTYVSFAKCLA